MSKFGMIDIICRDCGHKIQAFHKIVPPENMEEDILAIKKVPGCKKREQEITCPKCGGAHFDKSLKGNN